MEHKDKKDKRSSIKFDLDDNKVKKNVVWDTKKLEEQELEKKLYPKTKINEPKTPYLGNVNFVL